VLAVLNYNAQKVRPRIAPRPDLTDAQGRSARAAISSYVVTRTAAAKLLAVAPQDHQRAPSGAFAEAPRGRIARPIMRHSSLAGVND
jgi:hypothetical protein